MANPHKGEVGFAALGQDWIVRFGMNEMCSLEAELDKGFGEIMAGLVEAPRMTVIRTVFRAAVVGEISEEQAGRLIDDIGMARAVSLLTDAVERSMARPEPGARPPRRGAAGTGKLTALSG